jgi:hypothetical protein
MDKQLRDDGRGWKGKSMRRAFLTEVNVHERDKSRSIREIDDLIFFSENPLDFADRNPFFPFMHCCDGLRSSSGFGLRASGFGLRASGFGLRASGF